MAAEKDDESERARVRAWLSAQREAVEAYLARQGVRVAARPDVRWDLAPHLAVWQIGGGWVISGDLPTDYVLDETVESPRDAVRFFAGKFADMAECMLAGREYPGTRIGNPSNAAQQRELGDLLQRRASLLSDFADNDGLWPDELDEWQEKPE